MSDALYDEDLVAWADQQAAAVRTVARNRPELSNLLDWEHIAEELDALGSSEVRQVTGPLLQALIHLMKAHSDPEASAMAGWLAEIDNWLGDVRDDFKPSMAHRIDLDGLWARARRKAGLQLRPHDRSLAPDMPNACPFRLDDVLEPTFDARRALTLIAGTPAT